MEGKKTYNQIKEEALKKAEELTKTTGKDVFPCILNTHPFVMDTTSEEGEWVVAYIKAPTLYQKAKIIDHFEKDDKTMIGIEVLKVNLIKEHSYIGFSQPEISKNENIILGAALFITGKGFVFSIAQQIDGLKKNGQ